MKIIFDHSHGHVINNRVFCESFVIPEGESEDFLLEMVGSHRFNPQFIGINLRV